MVNDASAAQLATAIQYTLTLRVCIQRKQKKIYIEQKERKKEDINDFYPHDQIKCSLYSRNISDTIYAINKRETNK